MLRRAVELQPDGLDNCAASVACKAWQVALAGSAADSIYLHARTDSQEQLWQRLLSSRSSIKSLDLVRAASWSSNDWFTLQRSKHAAQTTLESIPTACRSLTLSEFCSHYLALYVQKAPKLEKLSFEWGIASEGSTQMHTMPDLTPFCCLTELDVQMENDENGDMCAQLVKRCPVSLQSLKLHAFSSEPEDDQPKAGLRALDLLEHYLPALTQLHLPTCFVTILEDNITCLGKLSSLSLTNSAVYGAKSLHFERLTALTHLDLTYTLFYWEDAFADFLDSFRAWPGLLVLKTTGCSSFEGTVCVVLGKVREAHVHYPVRFEFTDTCQMQL